MDASHLEFVNLTLLTEPMEKLNEGVKLLPEEYLKLESLKTELLEIARNREPDNAKYDDNYFPMPVVIGRVLKYARNLKPGLDIQAYLSPEEMYKQVCDLCTRISKEFEPKGPIVGSEKDRSINGTRILRTYIYTELATNKIADLTKDQFLYTIEEIELKFKRTIVNPGEMCGVLAAQSLGEP